MAKKQILLVCSLLTSSLVSPQQQAPEPPPTETITETKGAETTKFPEAEVGFQGNWRKKNDWLKQAQDKNDELQEAITKIQSAQKDFRNKLKTLDDMFDDFYRQTGFDKGKVEELFTGLAKEIEENKEKTRKLFSQVILNLDEETEKLATIIKTQYTDLESIDEAFKKEKISLDQLKLDTNAIVDLDNSVRDRSKKVDEQTQAAQTYIEQSTKLSEKIWHVIDDKKAKQIFYNLSGINEKMKALLQYITVDLMQDFATVTSTVENQIKKTKVSIEEVEKFEIIVSNRTARLEAARKQAEQEFKKQQLSEEERPKKAVTKKQITWYSKIKTFFVTLYEILFTGK